MPYTYVHLDGVEQMKAQLERMAQDVQRKIAAGATFDAAKVLKAEVISRAPVKSGTLRDNIIVKKDRVNDGGQVMYSVLVRPLKITKKARKNINALKKAGYTVAFSDNAFYWRFVEFGHRIVRNGKEFGSVPAHPFFRPSIDAVRDQLPKIMGEGLASRIEQSLKAA